MNESSASRTNTTKEAAVAFDLHLHADNTAESSAGQRASSVHERKPRDLESLIGGRWFSWIGIIAVTFGIAFFLKSLPGVCAACVCCG